MPIRLVDKMVTGKEPMIDPILAYLATKGVPAREIRSVVLIATVGEPLTLDVSLFVQGDEARLNGRTVAVPLQDEAAP